MEHEVPLQRPIEIERLEDSLRLSGIALLAFTPEQRKAIKRRDHRKCNFPEEGGHGGYLHIHHIIPKSLESITGIDPDHPLNGITICQEHHSKIHTPNGHKCAYATERGAVIWNETWDDKMMTAVLGNTREAIRGGWKFPDRKQND